MVLWRGIVSRRGSGKEQDPAEVIRQEVLNPIERPTGDCVWRSGNGTAYTAGLIAHRLARLETQINTPD
jgi:hypothetical protein